MASPHQSSLSHSHQHHQLHYISMSFDASSSDCLGAICGKYSILPSSNGIPSSCVPASRPCGHIQPPHTTGFPHTPLKDKEESVPFNHQKYPHKRGNIFQPYTSLSNIQSCTQKKGEGFKDLYIRDLVIASKLKWKGRSHNVEMSHFQEE